MKTRLPGPTLALLIATNPVLAQGPIPASAIPLPQEQYTIGSDAQEHAGVPQGKTFAFTLDHSQIFPGTRRQITVYVPAQYTGDTPACVYVGLDGIAIHAADLDFKVSTVFDNLIDQKAMPVTIAIGIAAGAVDSTNPPAGPRFNRSYEFDSLNGNLVRFLMEEVLPEVERYRTPDGQRIRLSRDPNDRAVGGMSTGGIGSFTLAWEHSDQFRRVFTAIGTFVGMRGGDRYPVLVRKTEPKPIRIFMQDGSNDEWAGGPEMGDWWMANQTLLRALQFAGYPVEHVWGEGGHNPKHAAAIFPDAMRWLWKDWPRPVVAGQSQNTFLTDILVTGEGWQDVPSSEARLLKLDSRHDRIPGPEGREYFTIKAAGDVWLHPAHGPNVRLDSGLNAPTGIVMSPDGLWLAVAESRSHWGYSYRVQGDGTVSNKQRFYWFHVPDDADDSGVGAWVMDRDGRLYAATRLGVQVFDHNGRVRAILPAPAGRIVSIEFGGPDRATLFVGTADHKFWHRKMNVPGAMPGGPPTEIPNWGPG